MSEFIAIGPPGSWVPGTVDKVIPTGQTHVTRVPRRVKGQHHGTTGLRA